MGDVRVLRTLHLAEHTSKEDEADGREATVLDITTGRRRTDDPDGGDAA